MGYQVAAAACQLLVEVGLGLLCLASQYGQEDQMKSIEKFPFYLVLKLPMDFARAVGWRGEVRMHWV